MTRSSKRLKLLALLAITLLAAFLRLYQIDTIPPGNRYDPAYYGVDALRILDGEWPIFLTTNFGREVMFSYLVALCVAILGPVSYSMYLVSAIVGILTVPAVYLVAEELLAGEEGTLGQFGGLLAAFTVAISYWHLNWSRFGVRAILLPLFTALLFYFLWRALRTGSRRLFVVSGTVLGLSVYTYQAARILPLLVVLAFAFCLIARRRVTRRDVVNLGIVALVALVIFAPLGLFFLTHPGTFYQRIEQTTVVSAAQDLGSNLQALGKSVASTLLTFGFYGDEEPTTNIPGRPTLNGYLSILLLVGLLVSLFRLKKPAYPFLLSWLAVMGIPAVLSQYGPSAKRLIGALPAVMILVAIGALVPWDIVGRWARHRESNWARGLARLVQLGIVVGFVYSGILTYAHYFVVWARDPDLFTHFEAGPTAIGQYVGSLPPGEQVYVSPVPANHPSIVYNAHLRAGIKGYDGRACIVVPRVPPQDTIYVIVPGEDPNSLNLLRAFFPQGGIVAEGPLHYQQPYFLAYRVPQGAEAQLLPSHPLEVHFGDELGDEIELLGYDLDADTYRPGDSVHVTLYYRARREMETDYTVFTHVLGPHNPATGGPLWGQSDSEPCQRAYRTSAWAPGEIVRDRFSIPIAGDAPPGEYQLEVGVYLLATMTRLPATDAAGDPLPNDAAPLGTITVGETGG